MRAAQGRNDLVVSLLRKDRFQPEFRYTLLPPPLADARRGALAAEERPRPLGVPGAALVVADAAGADRKERVADCFQRLAGDEDDELPVHVCALRTAGI